VATAAAAAAAMSASCCGQGAAGCGDACGGNTGVENANAACSAGRACDGAAKNAPSSGDAAPRARRFVGRRRKVGGAARGKDGENLGKVARARAARGTLANQVPDEIAKDPELARAMEQLPKNYDFQVAKTVWRLKKAGAKRVALQLPEGLLMFACILADIFEQLAGVEEALVMADVTYGACCVDDFGARSLGCDFMVHYGHSCLVPIDVTSREDEHGRALQVMYVFVDIDIDVEHMVECVKLTLPDRKGTKLAVMGTIQFAAAMHKAKTLLDAFYEEACIVPQAKPLSRGEVLGCTSPSLDGLGATAIVFVADGRFHLESAMIANPTVTALRYNPYDRELTREGYDTDKLLTTRWSEIETARPVKKWGIVLGTLGRQGSPAILKRIQALLLERGCECIVLLLSELFPAKLALLDASVGAWVQIACPRLSIDWGTAFSKPLLTPYEALVCFGETEWRHVYPQDYYAKEKAWA